MNIQRKKLYFLIILAIIILLSGCNRDITGNGTEDNPFVIHNLSGLEKIGEENKYSLDAHYKLGGDIDASKTENDDYNDGKGWEPIGEYNNDGTTRPFTGSFDGQNYKIKNLTIDRPNKETVGLFSYVEDGKISKLHLTEVDVKGKNYVGGVVGYNRGVIKETSTKGKITGKWKVGGITGWNFLGTIESSHSECNIVGTGWLGGLAGYNSSADIKTSFAEGKVTGEDWNIGGLVGSNRENGIISNSYARGSVKGYTRVGGLAGLNSGVIKKSYSTGKVKGDWLTGGLIGWNFEGTDKNSFWDMNTSGIDKSNGGKGRNTESMQSQANYKEWDFKKTWIIEENQEYPKHDN